MAAIQKRYIFKTGLDLNNKSITNLADPTGVQDAATKGFTSNADNITSGTLNVSRLATSGVTAGTYNNSTWSVTPLTIDDKGRITATGTALVITPAFSSITGKPTTLSGYGITDAVNLSGATLTGFLSVHADPTSDMHVANKRYVDQTVQGLKVKGSVKAATTTNITLSGTQTIDGISLVANDLVLVKNQTTSAQNGIYVLSATAWTRATNLDIWSEFVAAFVFVEQGTVNGDTGWVSTVDQNGTLGTTAITWSQFQGTSTVVGGTGITVTGNSVALSSVTNSNTGTLSKVSVDTYGRVTGTIAVTQADITELLGSGSISSTMLSTSGVTAGTYNNSTTSVTPLTIDDKGRITATGTAVTITPAFSSITGKPTTLSGYGITDALGTGTNQSLNLINSKYESVTLSTSSTTTVSLLSTPIITHRSCKLVLQVTQGSSYQISEIMVIHDGTNVYMTEYGNIVTNTTIANIDADISGGNLRILVTPSSSTTTVFKATVDFINI